MDHNNANLTKYRLVTFGLACLSVAVFYYLNVPLPFLFGPMFSCLIAALLGVPLVGFKTASTLARTILGVAVGSAITITLLTKIPEMAVSVALVPTFILIIGSIGVPFFRYVWKFDPVTSYYAAMPGGLQDMVSFGIEAGGDPRALSLIHATRLLLIVSLAPIALVHFYGASLTNPIGNSVSSLPAQELVLMGLAAIIGWKGGEKFDLFGASILGPMILATALSLTGFIHARPPREAILAAQFFIGIGVGVHFVGITVRELRNFVLAGATFVLILATLATIFERIVTGLGLAPPLDAFLAFAPGGQAEIAVLAIVTGADLGFVVVHHVTRMVLVITGAPLVSSLMKRR